MTDLKKERKDKRKSKSADGKLMSGQKVNAEVKKKKVFLKGGLKGKTKLKKPLAKETAKTRKERKLQRKKQKNPNFELSYQAKKIWEKLRIKKDRLPKEERAKMVDELMNLVKDKHKELTALCYAHDTSRVVQTCLKQGLPHQRQQIFEELKEYLLEMCKHKYARNIVWKILKYGSPEARNAIILSFKGNAYSLVKRSLSAIVVEYAYNNYATSAQRDFIVRHLYGRAFRFCENAETSSFAEMLRNEPDKKQLLLESFKRALEPFLEKSVIKHTLVHKAFYDFFQNCDESNLRSELIEGLRESLIHMIHTHDGAHVTMHCLWHGTKKDRKVIIKTMKEFIAKLSCEEFGHLPILAAFDAVDDTVFVNKALIQPLLKVTGDLVNNKYGRKVLLYLISPRNPSHFMKETVELLARGDDNKSSKKPMEQRHRELTEYASAAIINFVAKQLDELIFDRSRFVFVETTFLHCHGDKSSLVDSMLKLLENEYVADNEALHIVEDPCGHMVIKRLIRAESKQKNEDHSKEAHFSRALLKRLSGETLASWSGCNRGTQILLSLLESNDKEVSSTSANALNKFIHVIKRNSSVKSRDLLLKKLKS